MNITVYSKSKIHKNLLLICARFYAAALNLEKSKYDLHICSKRGLRKNEGKLGVTVYKEKEIFVVLDSKLMKRKLFTTLAHEMIHVKQIARGQYKHEFTEAGKLQQYWLGYQVKQEYFDRPWEVEAYRRENILADKLIKAWKSS